MAEERKAQIHGKIEGLRFIRLLKEIYDGRLTGILHLKRGNVVKEVYFKDGSPINARSNLTRETLGRVLLDRGFISQKDYSESLEIMDKTGKKHGQILLEMGVLPVSLKKALEMQAEERILDAFTWEEGTFRFIEKNDIEKYVNPLSLNPLKIIYEGTVKKAPLTILESVIKNYHSKKLTFTGENSIITSAKIQRSHLDFLQKFDGSKTVDEITKQSGVNILSAAKIILAGLILDLLKVEQVEVEKGAEAVEVAAPPSELEGESGLTDKDRKMYEALMRNLEELRKKNFFELFDIDPDKFSENELKKSYFKLARSFHPDRFYTFHPRVKEVAGEIFTFINDAFHTLINPEERDNYSASLSATGKGITEKDARAALSAEIEFQKGEILLKRGKVEEAVEYFEKAYKLKPEEPEYGAYLGWALFRIGKRKGNEALVQRGKNLVKTAVEKSEGSEKTHFFMGQILKIENDLHGAIRHFEKVIRINPENIDAERELRILRTRLEKVESEKERSGLFKKLFKK